MDWNQSFYEVAAFAQAHGLSEIRIQPLIMADVRSWIPQGRLWNCQEAGPADAGNWVAVSASTLFSGRECSWMVKYPREPLGGGSMYAIHLPAALPAPGTQGRPVVQPSPLKKFGLDNDVASLYLSLLNHPETFPAVLAHFEPAVTEEAERKAKRLLDFIGIRDSGQQF